jgi:hypothetical protein
MRLWMLLLCLGPNTEPARARPIDPWTQRSELVPVLLLPCVPQFAHVRPRGINVSASGRQEFYGEGVKLKGLVQFDDG